jgi:dolichol-phosphate mannosyltransferase
MGEAMVETTATTTSLSTPSVVVCLPTYNERENIDSMVRALGDVLPPGGRVLVIDDNSPDGTGQIADGLAAELGFVDVLHRSRKEGLGPAYIAGFSWALEREATYIIEMDCDFSHDPFDIPRLLEAARDSALVIGSRYVPGGSVPDWPFARRAVSRFGSLYARMILGLGVADLTGGFKCYRRDALEAIDPPSIESRGYMFQIETTFRIVRAGFSIVEIPIAFVDRREGKSKMGGAIIFEALWRVPWLRFVDCAGLRREREAFRRPSVESNGAPARASEPARR